MLSLFQIIKWYCLTCYSNYYFNSREKLLAWQNEKTKEIINFAVKNSKFYKEFYSTYTLNNWENLPTINKTILMENFSALNTAGIEFKTAYEIAIKAEESRDFTSKIGDVTVGLSSGTSGNRGLFLVNERERLAWAGAILAKMLPKSLFKKQRIAFFLRANSNIYTTLNSRLIQFDFYDLLNDVESYIKKLTQFQPTILVAPPSMLRILAEAKKQGKLSIKPIKIISVAEVLEPIDKEYIEKEFNQIVHQIYQATEGFLATTCQHGTLHLNEDIILVQKEYIDPAKRKFIPIITDLYRKTQPIIRYRLNDILTERQAPCPCGSIYTALEQIDGRCDDLFYIKPLKSEKLKPLFPDFIRRAIITSSPSILEYMVTQLSPLELQINLHCNRDSLSEVQNQIQQNISDLFEQTSAVCPTIKFGEFTPPEKGVKLRRILRKFSVNEDNLI